MNDHVFEETQINACKQHGQEFARCPAESTLGFAIQTLAKEPIHGLRHKPEADTSGWYIWCGEYSSAADFFSPFHAIHIYEKLPEVAKYLGLPPGYRFLLAKDHVDVWFDSSLLAE
jgi:hypothetical protein